jgi:hypothetical protein
MLNIAEVFRNTTNWGIAMVPDAIVVDSLSIGFCGFRVFSGPKTQTNQLLPS